MSLHALVEKWRKEAAAYDAAYQRTASGWQPDWQSYGMGLTRERCAEELEEAAAVTKADFMKAVSIELMLAFADNSAAAALAYTAINKVAAIALTPGGSRE